MPEQSIPLVVPQIKLEVGRGFGAAFLRYKQKLEEGFADEFEAWGEEVALPYIEENWPRANWPPLTDETIQRKASRGQPAPEVALIGWGDLFTAATTRDAKGNRFVVGPDSLVIGVDTDVIPYADAQYYGYRNIPARPWDDLGGEDGEPMDRLRERLEDALLAAFEGR